MQPKDPTPPPSDANPPKHFANPGSYRRTAQSRWFADTRAPFGLGSPDGAPPVGLSFHRTRPLPPAPPKQPQAPGLASVTPSTQKSRPAKGGSIAVLHNTRSPT